MLPSVRECSMSGIVKRFTAFKVHIGLLSVVHIIQYPQAEARQAKFEQSAGGKAAMKSVKAVKAEREAFKRQQESKDTAGDWLS